MSACTWQQSTPDTTTTNGTAIYACIQWGGRGVNVGIYGIHGVFGYSGGHCNAMQGIIIRLRSIYLSASKLAL